MHRRLEQIRCWRDLDDTAEIHHADPRRHVADNGQIVRDEEIRQAELVLQITHEIQDLRLDRDVERRCWFVTDKKFWF